MSSYRGANIDSFFGPNEKPFRTEYAPICGADYPPHRSAFGINLRTNGICFYALYSLLKLALPSVFLTFNHCQEIIRYYFAFLWLWHIVSGLYWHCKHRALSIKISLAKKSLNYSVMFFCNLILEWDCGLIHMMHWTWGIKGLPLIIYTSSHYAQIDFCGFCTQNEIYQKRCTLHPSIRICHLKRFPFINDVH